MERRLPLLHSVPYPLPPSHGGRAGDGGKMNKSYYFKTRSDAIYNTIEVAVESTLTQMPINATETALVVMNADPDK
jgi:hypothetical protein